MSALRHRRARGTVLGGHLCVVTLDVDFDFDFSGGDGKFQVLTNRNLYGTLVRSVCAMDPMTSKAWLKHPTKAGLRLGRMPAVLEKLRDARLDLRRSKPTDRWPTEAVRKSQDKKNS